MGPGRGGLGFTGENAGKRGRELMKEAAGPHAENTACFSLNCAHSSPIHSSE